MRRVIQPGQPRAELRAEASTGRRESGGCGGLLPERLEALQCPAAPAFAPDDRDERGVDGFPQVAQALKRELSRSRFGSVHPSEPCDYPLVEVGGEGGPLEDAPVAIEPVTRLRVSRGDRIDEVEDDVTTDEVRVPELVRTDLHNR